MRMTEEEFRNETAYSVTMTQVKKMLEMGFITIEEYWKINAKMKSKYHPVSDGLISEIDLICVQNRA